LELAERCSLFGRGIAGAQANAPSSVNLQRCMEVLLKSWEIDAFVFRRPSSQSEYFQH
jgi:hypothetical protein